MIIAEIDTHCIIQKINVHSLLYADLCLTNKNQMKHDAESAFADRFH